MPGISKRVQMSSYFINFWYRISYDLNGNMTQWMDAKNGWAMDLTWDDENRLKSTSEQGKTTVYAYDYAGTRVLKRGQTVASNNTLSG